MNAVNDKMINALRADKLINFYHERSEYLSQVVNEHLSRSIYHERSELKFVWFQHILIRLENKYIVEETRHRKRAYSAGNRRVRSDLVFDSIDIYVADRFAVDMSVSDIYDNLRLIITEKTSINQMNFPRTANDIIWLFGHRFDLFKRIIFIERSDRCSSFDAINDQRPADDIALSNDRNCFSFHIA